jgi:DivIVA domain-containing protein
MYRDRIVLTSRDILEKEFKIDTRGYRPQEVDRFLDMIIKDYEEMNAIIRELEREKKQLVEDNISLKQDVRNLKTKIEVLAESDGGSTTNADMLRRISKLEKIIYGKE